MRFNPINNSLGPRFLDPLLSFKGDKCLVNVHYLTVLIFLSRQ